MFTPRRRRFMRLSVVPPALAAMGLRNRHPLSVNSPQRLLAVHALHAHHHCKRRGVPNTANQELLPTHFANEKELRGTCAETKREHFENVKLRLPSELR